MKFLTIRRTPLDLASPCWTWEGDHGNGYGRIMADGQTRYVHRLAYQLHVGPIPRGWQVDHVCHTEAVSRGECNGGECIHRLCWNPAHLEAVSSAENTRRGGHPLVVVSRLGTCRRGHDLSDPSNVYVRPDGRRQCRECKKGTQRARRTIK